MLNFSGAFAPLLPCRIPDIPAMKKTSIWDLVRLGTLWSEFPPKVEFSCLNLSWYTLSNFDIFQLIKSALLQWHWLKLLGLWTQISCFRNKQQTPKELFCLLILDLWSESARDEIVNLWDSVHSEWPNRKKQHYCFPEKALWPLVSIAFQLGRKIFLSVLCLLPFLFI